VNGDTALVLQDANNLRIPTLTAGTDTGLTLTGSTSGENGINNVVLEGDAQTFFSTGSTGDYSFNISGTGNLAFNPILQQAFQEQIPIQGAPFFPTTLLLLEPLYLCKAQLMEIMLPQPLILIRHLMEPTLGL